MSDLQKLCEEYDDLGERIARGRAANATLTTRVSYSDLSKARHRIATQMISALRESIAEKDAQISDLRNRVSASDEAITLLKAALAQKDEALREIVDHGELWKVDPHNPERNHMERWLCLSNLAKAALSAAPRDETCATCEQEAQCDLAYAHGFQAGWNSGLANDTARLDAVTKTNLDALKAMKPCPDCKAQEGE